MSSCVIWNFYYTDSERHPLTDSPGRDSPQHSCSVSSDSSLSVDSSSRLRPINYYNGLVKREYATLPSIQGLLDHMSSERPKKLLVFTLETLATISTVPFPNSKSSVDFSVSSDGNHFFVRPHARLFEFVEGIPSTIEIGVWSYLTSLDCARKIAHAIFGARTLFIFIRINCKQTQTPKGKAVFLKLLSSISKVYDRFHSSNTLLVDSDPVCLIKNPFHTYVCRPPLNKPSSWKSTFLVDVLLPYLLHLEDAWDVRCFVRNHHPRWSSLRIKESTTFPTYKGLVKMCFLPYPSENVIPKYPLTLLSPHEIPAETRRTLEIFSEKYQKKNRPPTDTNVRELAKRLHFQDDVFPAKRLHFQDDVFPKGFWPQQHYPASGLEKYDLEECSDAELMDWIDDAFI